MIFCSTEAEQIILVPKFKLVDSVLKLHGAARLWLHKVKGVGRGDNQSCQWLLCWKEKQHNVDKVRDWEKQKKHSLISI